MSGLSFQKKRSDDTTGCVLRREVPLRMLAGVPIPRSRVHAVVARDLHPISTHLSRQSFTIHDGMKSRVTHCGCWREKMRVIWD